MESKDVRSSDHEGIISLLESVLSHFPINIPSIECKKKPYERCNKRSGPSYPKMFHGIPHKNIILSAYLHSIHCSENLKKSSVVYFSYLYGLTFLCSGETLHFTVRSFGFLTPPLCVSAMYARPNLSSYDVLCP
jgi:hypothetical protein